ncbi:hypothetical protein ASF72_16535 [Arthrobacter sp. Leaf141]|nr:hypothetical protein ASF72_16535 [Arthrobacter sp. Leaf141]
MPMPMAYLGTDRHAAAEALLVCKNPAARELSAAWEQNHEVHDGGASGEIPYTGQPSPTLKQSY